MKVYLRNQNYMTGLNSPIETWFWYWMTWWRKSHKVKLCWLYIQLYPIIWVLPCLILFSQPIPKDHTYVPSVWTPMSLFSCPTHARPMNTGFWPRIYFQDSLNILQNHIEMLWREKGMVISWLTPHLMLIQSADACEQVFFWVNSAQYV